MVNSLSRATSQHGVLPLRHRTENSGSAFRQSLSAAAPASQGMAALFGGAQSTASQNVATPAATSQNSVTTPAATTTQPTGDAAVLQSLKSALAAAGVYSDGLGLATHQDVVTSPGGAYVNRYISVNVHGHEEGLMTDLVAMNPNVAVLDIKRMLGMA